MKDEDQKRYVQVLEKLLARVEAADEGSPELDREIAAVFPSAPPGVSNSIDAVVNLLNAELRNWWWTCGYCKATNDASLYSPGSYNVHASFGPDGLWGGREALRLIYDKKWGPCFDHGFHRDRQGGTVPLSMLSIFLQAQIALAEANRSTDPEVKRREELEAIRTYEERLKKARAIFQELGMLPRE
jgi:hypothetical protein